MTSVAITYRLMSLLSPSYLQFKLITLLMSLESPELASKFCKWIFTFDEGATVTKFSPIQIIVFQRLRGHAVG
jgi:hypothetical protein